MPLSVAPGVVLDLLDPDQIGRAEVVDDLGREPRQRRRVARVEVLDIEGRDRDLLVARRLGRLRADRAREERRHVERLDLVVRERVVERADDRAEDARPDVHHGHRPRRPRRDLVAQDLVVDRKPLRVEVGVAGRGEDAASRRPRARRPEAIVGKQRDLAEALGLVHDGTVVDLDEHPLEALPEVDPVLGGVEGRRAGLDAAVRVVVDHLGRRRAAAQADHRRTREPDSRWR